MLTDTTMLHSWMKRISRLHWCTLCKRCSLSAEGGTVGWEIVGLIIMRRTAFVSPVLHIFSRIIHAFLAYFCETLVIQGVKKLEIAKESNLFGLGCSFLYKNRADWCFNYLIETFNGTSPGHLGELRQSTLDESRRCRARKVISWLLEFALRVGLSSWRPETSKYKQGFYSSRKMKEPWEAIGRKSSANQKKCFFEARKPDMRWLMYGF